MGLLDWFTGNSKADPNIAPRDPDALKQALLSLNGDDLPWQVQIPKDGKADLVAGWKFEDPRWQEKLYQAFPDKSVHMVMRLDAKNHIVRAVDQNLTVEWQVGPTGIALVAHGFRGQKNEFSRTYTFGRKSDGEFGELGEAGFSTSDFKTPIRQVVKESGWAWHGVIFGRL